jgi:predicted phosphodiesterase
MARLGIISDIHGNRVALEAVLREVDRRDVDALVCLGDIVGYGPEPAACLSIVRRTCRLVIRGNHEEAVVQPGGVATMNAVARVGVEFARKQLSEAELGMVRRLPASFSISRMVLGVHDSPAPAEFGARYLRGISDAAEAFEWFEEPFCLVGHTHVPMCVTTTVEAREGIVTPDDIEVRAVAEAPDSGIVLPDSGRAIINPGSVGQPRDRDPRASFAVLDLGRGTVEFPRVEYDIAEAMRRAEQAGLPGILGERLAIGA